MMGGSSISFLCPFSRTWALVMMKLRRSQHSPVWLDSRQTLLHLRSLKRTSSRVPKLYESDGFFKPTVLNFWAGMALQTGFNGPETLWQRPQREPEDVSSFLCFTLYWQHKSCNALTKYDRLDVTSVNRSWSFFKPPRSYPKIQHFRAYSYLHLLNVAYITPSSPRPSKSIRLSFTAMWWSSCAPINCVPPSRSPCITVEMVWPLDDTQNSFFQRKALCLGRGLLAEPWIPAGSTAECSEDGSTPAIKTTGMPANFLLSTRLRRRSRHGWLMFGGSASLKPPTNINMSHWAMFGEQKTFWRRIAWIFKHFRFLAHFLWDQSNRKYLRLFGMLWSLSMR